MITPLLSGTFLLYDFGKPDKRLKIKGLEKVHFKCR
jgi:hypothetical protein